MSRAASPVGGSETDAGGEKRSEKEGARACAESWAVGARPRRGRSANRAARSPRPGHAHSRHRDTGTARTLCLAACVTAPFVDRRSGRAVSAAHSRGRGYHYLRARPRPPLLMTFAGRLRGRLVHLRAEERETTLSRAKGDVPRKWPVSEPRARLSILNPCRAAGVFT